jgi:regulator of replication initiation timing
MDSLQFVATTAAGCGVLALVLLVSLCKMLAASITAQTELRTENSRLQYRLDSMMASRDQAESQLNQIKAVFGYDEE